MSPKVAAILLAVGVAGAPGVAQAGIGLGGHLAATLGHGIRPHAEGFRGNLDLGVHLSPVSGTTGEDKSSQLLLVGLDGALGFEKSVPVDLALEVGFLSQSWLFAFGFLCGPELRVNPAVGAGAEGRVFLRLLFLEVGLKVSGIVGSAGSDVQVLGTLGLGLTFPL